MSNPSQYKPPSDAAERRAAPPIVCYNVDQLPACDMQLYQRARKDMGKVSELRIEPRDGAGFEVPAGHYFRIVSIEGPQVGDLNLHMKGQALQLTLIGITYCHSSEWEIIWQDH